MTPKQALAACIKIDPKRTYCVKREDWHHSSDHQNTDYSIAVLPGVHGDVCDHFNSLAGFAVCVANYRAAHAAAK